MTEQHEQQKSKGKMNPCYNSSKRNTNKRNRNKVSYIKNYSIYQYNTVIQTYPVKKGNQFVRNNIEILHNDDDDKYIK